MNQHNQGVSHIAHEVLLDEFDENTHMERVEDVIVWALEHYAKTKVGTTGAAVAYAIVERIHEEETRHQEQNN